MLRSSTMRPQYTDLFRRLHRFVYRLHSSGTACHDERQYRRQVLYTCSIILDKALTLVARRIAKPFPLIVLNYIFNMMFEWSFLNVCRWNRFCCNMFWVWPWNQIDWLAYLRLSGWCSWQRRQVLRRIIRCRYPSSSLENDKTRRAQGFRQTRTRRHCHEIRSTVPRNHTILAGSHDGCARTLCGISVATYYIHNNVLLAASA